MQQGSEQFSVRVSDGVATLRDAALLIVTHAVSWSGQQFIEGGFSPELQAALVVVVFAAIKFGWKYITDTRRMKAT